MKGKLLTALVVLALVLGTVLVACDDGSHVYVKDPVDGTKVTLDKYLLDGSNSLPADDAALVATDGSAFNYDPTQDPQYP